MDAKPRLWNHPALGHLYLEEGLRTTLRWRWPKRFQTLSWALVGGGWSEQEEVFWLQVSSEDLPLDCCPRRFLEQELASRGVERSVGLMTSASVADYVSIILQDGDCLAQAVVTVGLGNALRAGDPIISRPRCSTINIACAVNQALSFEAALEAQAIVTEAKAAALLDTGIISRISGQPATGTGTDCHVIASPIEGPPLIYAGKHTYAGAVLGATVYQAVRQGTLQWCRRFPSHPVRRERE
jgi:adenosylcobinamide amidohydrolase